MCSSLKPACKSSLGEGWGSEGEVRADDFLFRRLLKKQAEGRFEFQHAKSAPILHVSDATYHYARSLFAYLLTSLGFAVYLQTSN